MSSCSSQTNIVRDIASRETGDKSKIRDFLPQNKQYLVTRGVPCLRRATSLAYTDADEDAERLLSFSDASGASTSGDGDEWVETHAGRRSALVSLQNQGEIRDIPDLDGTGDIAHVIGGIHLTDGSGTGKEKEVSEIPDLDDIPDMEEDLEDEDEATAAKRKPTPAVPVFSDINADQRGVIDVRHVASCSSYIYVLARHLIVLFTS